MRSFFGNAFAKDAGITFGQRGSGVSGEETLPVVHTRHNDLPVSKQAGVQGKRPGPDESDGDSHDEQIDTRQTAETGIPSRLPQLQACTCEDGKEAGQGRQ